MGGLGRDAWAWLGVVAVMLLAQLAGASHVVYENHLDLEAAAAAVPPSIVDPQLRPGYHFQPPKNWINDPNAPLYYKGWYHFFYQYNPRGAVWGNIVWAHSVSRDLINWVALEPAIEPSIPSDQYGCWSGSATMLPDGTPAIMYTGIDRPGVSYQVQNVAYPRNRSDPLLREWVKPGYNPIIVPEGGINATQFRDPTTAWRAGGRWRLLVGSVAAAGGGGARGAAFVYRSRDFLRWARVRRPLHSAPTGMWECPDFYPVEAAGRREGLDTSVPGRPRVKYVLKNSLDLRRYDYYTVGTYDRRAERYVPDDPAGDECRLRYDYGNFYASKTFYDPARRRRVLWGWANESDTTADDVAKGWAGIQAIPRTVWLDPSGKQLLQWPVEEVDALRGKSVTLKGRVLKPGQHLEVTGLQTAQIDRSVVESFGAGGETCILSRVYPSLAIGKNARLYAFNNGKADVKVSRLKAWEMRKPLMNGA
ncbi:beta-fructofuranosidase, insoluble isoenzyme 2-like isoform X2 [Panicum virgatum]|uniref:Beta-fructofuranosidase n=1 Tax=Panicum virgatum TaxID=38727 RepID=A0A8T0QHI4_PANVG|nr:beta-fructofuranosidase, insoluble isoenzyme 2-like isoform X2 [Panicum virgatum]KAG2572012.1 hypothetical protein PVAP13_7KG144210 [Panicum virgatum]